jgi:ribA/ribD-fused uncharacterized protein
MDGHFIFYFGPEYEFSHWYKSNMSVDGIDFCCAGQYIMYKKALLFGDEVAAKKILRSSDPKRHRVIGKEVKAFTKDIWQQHCMDFSFAANFAKFDQNENLKTKLLDTAASILAEASPYDRVWGIGLSMGNSDIYDRTKWRGKNLAGESLMQARNALKLRV